MALKNHAVYPDRITYIVTYYNKYTNSEVWEEFETVEEAKTYAEDAVKGYLEDTICACAHIHKSIYINTFDSNLHIKERF